MRTYSIRGAYKILFYTFLIGFCEEFIFRWYTYKLLVPINRKGAILISGVFFGMGHAVLPIVHGQLPLEKAVIEILDYSYKWYGLAITICVCAYFFVSHKREAVNCSVISGRE